MFRHLFHTLNNQQYAMVCIFCSKKQIAHYAQLYIQIPQAKLYRVCSDICFTGTLDNQQYAMVCMHFLL